MPVRAARGPLVPTGGLETLTAMDERGTTKALRRPTGLKTLEILPFDTRHSKSTEADESDSGPTPTTCPDPAATPSCADPVAVLVRRLSEGAERPTPCESATISGSLGEGDAPSQNNAALESRPSSCDVSEPSTELAAAPGWEETSPAIQRLLESSPGTPERLRSIDEMLASLSAVNQLPPYAAVQAKKQKLDAVAAP